jgi:Flp pilus assembly protein TadD
MNKENVLFGVVGLLAGLIIGFMFANSVNQKGPVAPTADMRLNSNMPPDHPAVPPGTTAPGSTQGTITPEMQAAIDQAIAAPTDFDAQVKAADAYYQTGRFDDAIVFLKAANKVKPEDREVVVHLGNAHFDAEKYEEAEKWYTAALAKKADDVNVRTDLGLTYVFRSPPDYDKAIKEFNQSLQTDPNHIQTLQNITVAYTKKGDTAKAQASLAQLESVDPKNTAIARLKEDLKTKGTK